MQVNSISSIRLIFRDSGSCDIKVLSDLYYNKKDHSIVPASLTYSIQRRGKPNSFIWHDSHLRPLTPKLLNWLREFVTLFDTNDMLWMASVGSADPKFRPYLMEYYNEHKSSA